MEKKNKKNLTLNIISKIIQWLPIGVYGCFNLREFYSAPKSGITISAIIVLGALLFWFKDSFKEWITKPSAFKYVAIVWILALVFTLLGDQMFIVSTILLASQLASIPIDVWQKNVKKEALDNKALQDLKELILG